MPPHPAKTRLREALRARRAALPPAVATLSSRRLVDAILAHPAWTRAKGVAAFVGVRGEPHTRPLLEAALEGGRRLWLPRVVDAMAGSSVLVEITSTEQLAPAAFGLLEPAPRDDELRFESVPVGGPIDLALVPGLAFGSQGARIGFGPGHYDRLLESVATLEHPVRMGVCFADFFDPPEGPIPTESHDVPMHWVATEDGVTRCTPVVSG
ncbi:MAG: 5-formyltetrahydrofolate cyclo-ligase [Myxococcota bacterium]